MSVTLLSCHHRKDEPPHPPIAVPSSGPSSSTHADVSPTNAVQRPPVSLGLDPFYEKYVDAQSIPIVGSKRVPDLALFAARDIVQGMLRKRSDVRQAMIEHHARVAVMARSEVTTHLPEQADIYETDPGEDWNRRARGLGGSLEQPVISVGAENLLCSPDDIYYPGESVLVHEFAHGMHKLGISFTDPSFEDDLKRAYEAAVAKKKWAHTYAESNPDEYWAEGVQSYFDTNLHANPPDGIHNEVHLRKQLKAYDPTLYALLTRVFADDEWRPTCPPSQPSPPSLVLDKPPTRESKTVRCSSDSTTHVPVSVKNQKPSPVALFWVDFDCQEKFYARIKPGGQAPQDTFEGHVWRIRDAKTNTLIGEFVASAATGNEVVIR